MMKSMLIMSVLLSLMIANMVLCRNRPDTLNSVFLSNDYETEDKKTSAYDDGIFRSDFDDSGGVTGERTKTNKLIYKFQNEEDLSNNNNGNIATKSDGEKKLKLLTLYPTLQKNQDTSMNQDFYIMTKDDSDKSLMKKRQRHSINAPLAEIARILEEARQRQEANENRQRLLAIGRK